MSPSLGDDGQAGSPEAEKGMTDVPGLSAERSGAGDDEELEELLRFIRDARGFDFTGYKRSSIGRRVHRRMHEVRTESIADYRDKLEADVDEFTYLFNTILINLTGFFRDASSWQYLQAEVLPQIISRRGMAQPIRIWSAGYATGGGALHHCHPHGRAAGAPGDGPPSEDLRHRHRPRGVGASTRRRLFRAVAGGCPRGPAGEVLRGGHPRARLGHHPEPSSDGGLRPPRSDQGSPDLAGGPGGLPQHADVPHRRDTGVRDPAPAVPRCETVATSSSGTPKWFFEAVPSGSTRSASSIGSSSPRPTSCGAAWVRVRSADPSTSGRPRCAREWGTSSPTSTRIRSCLPRWPRSRWTSG